MPKKPLANGAKGEKARVQRAEAAIEEILKRENVVITAAKIRILFKGENDRYSGNDALSTDTLSRVEIRFPVGTLLVPQVRLEAAQQPKTEAK
jgi:hypothetical protein